MKIQIYITGRSYHLGNDYPDQLDLPDGATVAAALKTLEIFERDQIVQSAASLGEMAAAKMAPWEEKYGIVGQVRSLGLLLGVSFRHPDKGGDDIHIARSVRDEMLRQGVWAICDFERQVRLYPALNMNEGILLEGLAVMEAAIEYVERNGVSVGDYPAMPSGNVGF